MHERSQGFQILEIRESWGWTWLKGSGSPAAGLTNPKINSGARRPLPINVQ